MDMISGNVPCVSDPYRNVDTDYGRFILTGAGTLLRVTVIVTRDNVCDMSGGQDFIVRLAIQVLLKHLVVRI